ncbi:MAG: hypothetical protein JSU90_04000, partial [Nitrospiraceae bacterium]
MSRKGWPVRGVWLVRAKLTLFRSCVYNSFDMKGLILKSLAVVLVATSGILAGGYFALVRGVPNIEEIKGYLPANGARVYADDDTLIGEFK